MPIKYRLMGKNAQSALEYILLMGGAVIIAVIVTTLLLNLGSYNRTDYENAVFDLEMKRMESLISGNSLGVVSYWSFDGGLSDQFSTKNEIFPTGSGGLVIDQERGKVFRCGGNYAVITQTSMVPEAGTVMAWIKPYDMAWGFWQSYNDGQHPRNQSLWAKTQRGTLDRQWEFTFGMKATQNGADNKQSGVTMGANTQFPNGRWTHLAITWDEDSMSIYRNGVLEAYNNNPQHLSMIDGTGRICWATGNGGDIDIDDLFLFNRALQEKEIERLMNYVAKNVS